jgi:hypothetical protein
MIGFQYLPSAFAEMAWRDARHDRSIGNTQVFDSIDFEIAAWALGSALNCSICIGFHKSAFSRGDSLKAWWFS